VHPGRCAIVAAPHGHVSKGNTRYRHQPANTHGGDARPRRWEVRATAAVTLQHMMERNTELSGTDRTADGVLITEGLRVWTNDLERGHISLAEAGYETNQNTGDKTLWFHVIRRPGDRGVLQSSDRVATRFQGKSA
jgi:hypothetical protein